MSSLRDQQPTAVVKLLLFLLQPRRLLHQVDLQEDLLVANGLKTETHSLAWVVTHGEMEVRSQDTNSKEIQMVALAMIHSLAWVEDTSLAALGETHSLE